MMSLRRSVINSLCLGSFIFGVNAPNGVRADAAHRAALPNQNEQKVAKKNYLSLVLKFDKRVKGTEKQFLEAQQTAPSLELLDNLGFIQPERYESFYAPTVTSQTLQPGFTDVGANKASNDRKSLAWDATLDEGVKAPRLLIFDPMCKMWPGLQPITIVLVDNNFKVIDWLESRDSDWFESASLDTSTALLILEVRSRQRQGGTHLEKFNITKNTIEKINSAVVSERVMVGWQHASLAQSQSASLISNSLGAGVDRAEYPDVPRGHWTYKSFKLLTDLSVFYEVPMPFRSMTRYEMAVAIARQVDHLKDKNFIFPPLAQTNAAFYAKDELGNWLPRHTRAEVRAIVLKLCQEFTPELARLGRIGGGLTENQIIDKYFAYPDPVPAPKTIEARILKADFLTEYSPGRMDLAAAIALPVGCQLTALPTWSWQILSVQWRATAHDPWGKAPPYTMTLISSETSPNPQYECVLASGEWHIKVQATVHYQTNCGSGTVVAVDYVGSEPTQSVPEKLPDREARRLSDTTPDSPKKAQRLNAHGTVRLRLSVSAQGAVESAQITQSSGYDVLDQAAQQWAIGLKYEPARRDGVDVASIANIMAHFDVVH